MSPRVVGASTSTNPGALPRFTLEAPMFKRLYHEWFRPAGLSLLLLLTVISLAGVFQFGLPEIAFAQGDGGGTPPPKQEPLLTWIIASLGWLYLIVFLSLSFTLVALFVMNVLMLRRSKVVPLELVDQFEAHLDEKEYQEAYELAKMDESFLGQVLSAGLGKLSAGYAQAIEAMQEVGEEEDMKIEHRLSYMALIGTLAPMIGLFGTVHGMIDSFRKIAGSDTAPKPKELAEGISKALFTTLAGLLIAIPAIGAFTILKNRASRLVLEVGILSEGLMSRFQGVGKDKKSA
ncbi:MAG: MotA/TolQ/ExbB proton channel family protein [Planctomycetota bacterium]|nr:MAG: MotA/TolQ/ExbB proton channel family protein [Planctomycetota bacterium]REK23515.1 MAG: MotA/TolQ/ExbB proton channel family protein [Planctomycetota bacterium]REK40428.1 MAG: MotA/TolQ/ExbB proton channel family protein [Planctomycetota bacterium]